MTRAGDVALILLAAGLSRRFGEADKLLAPLRGKPLLQHSVDLLAGFPFGERIAVVRGDAPEVAALLHGYRLVVNPAPERGRGSSLALGVAAIEHADACLVWLGDMPGVPAGHVQALLAHEAEVVASSVGGVNQPPALFRRAHFAALAAARGDAGPQALLSAAAAVAASGEELRDVDSPADLSHGD